AAFGLAISAFFVVSAVMSIPGGIVAQRMSSRQGMFLCGVLTGVPLLGIALLSRNWWTFVLFLTIGGLGNALSQPVANRVLIDVVPFNRRGMAFGVKQSAVPLSGLLAGVAVPIVAHVGSWRWVVALVA